MSFEEAAKPQRQKIKLSTVTLISFIYIDPAKSRSTAKFRVTPKKDGIKGEYVVYLGLVKNYMSKTEGFLYGEHKP